MAASLATFGMATTAEAKSFIDYLKPTPITCAPLSSASWGVAGVLPRDLCNGIESAKGAGVPPEYYYWDGQIIAAKDGTYHMFMSTWAGSTGFQNWTNSESYHAVSAQGVLGPYTRKGYIWSSGSHRGHNTTALELPDGTYAVVVSEVVPFTIYKSSSLDGPWTACTATIQTNGVNAGTDGHYDSNVSLTARHDGKFEIVQRHGLIAIADTLCGPYKMQKPTWTYPAANRPSIDSIYPKRSSIPGVSNPTYAWEEDPHIWRSGGIYHVLYSGSGDRVGYHLYSPDGINNWTDDGLAFGPREYQKIFCYAESTTCTQWYKMERPGVVLQGNHPTHITWAVSDVDKDNQIPANSNHGSKVIVVPFDGVSFDNDYGVGGASGGAGGNVGGNGGATTGGVPGTGGAPSGAGTKSTGGSSTANSSSGRGGTKAAGGSSGTAGTVMNSGGVVSTRGGNATGGLTIAPNSGGKSPITTDPRGQAGTGEASTSVGGAVATGGALSSSSSGQLAAGGGLAAGGAAAVVGNGGAGGAANSMTSSNTASGSEASADPSGCGCRVAGGPAPSKSLAILGILGLLSRRRSRRRAHV